MWEDAILKYIKYVKCLNYVLELRGERIRVSFENINRNAIPEEYHYEFRNAILRKVQEIDSSLSASMHDKWNKFFTFSGFLGKQWNTPLGLVFKNVDVVFASPDLPVMAAIKNAFLMKPKFPLFDSLIIVNSVKQDNIKLENGTTKLSYESLGEIVIKKGNENGRTVHVGEGDDIELNVENIIKKQFSAFSGHDPELKVRIMDFKQKKKSIVKNGIALNSFRTLRLRFELEADEQVHYFLLTQGIGHHRKMGFGLVGIAKQRMGSP